MRRPTLWDAKKWRIRVRIHQWNSWTQMSLGIRLVLLEFYGYWYKFMNFEMCKKEDMFDRSNKCLKISNCRKKKGYYWGTQYISRLTKKYVYRLSFVFYCILRWSALIAPLVILHINWNWNSVDCITVYLDIPEFIFYYLLSYLCSM